MSGSPQAPAQTQGSLEPVTSLKVEFLLGEKQSEPHSDSEASGVLRVPGVGPSLGGGRWLHPYVDHQGHVPCGLTGGGYLLDTPSL